MILKREDESRVKIIIDYSANSKGIAFNFRVMNCRYKKRKFREKKRYLEFVTMEEIKGALLELWEKLKPSFSESQF